jgi:hypothetical protein
VLSLTGQQVINGALTTLGLLEQGGSPSVSDSNDALFELNNAWNAWGIDEGLVFATTSAQFTLTISTGSYAMGPTASSPFNVTPPARIYGAKFVTSGQRNSLRIVNADEYYAHKDLAASAVAPDELYPDFNVASGTGNVTLYLWPVPSVAGASLELDYSAPFGTWSLTGTYVVPPGFYDLLNYGLAFRLLPRYGATVSPQIAQTVAAIAERSESRIREMNRINRQLPPGTESQPTPPQPTAQPAER